jgi:hypothetical protein
VDEVGLGDEVAKEDEAARGDEVSLEVVLRGVGKPEADTL